MNPVALLSIGTLAGAGTSVARAATNIGGNFADRLRSALGGSEPKPGDAVRSETPSLGKQATTAVRELQARLRGFLARHGVAIDEPLVVTQDQFDRVRVVGDHPQRVAIESLLGAEPELGDALRDLATRLLGTQSAGHAIPGLPIAYERDGKATLELTVPPRSDHVLG